MPVRPEQLAYDDDDGTVAVVIQEHRSGAVVQVGYLDRELLEQSVSDGTPRLRSRRGGELSTIPAWRITAVRVSADRRALVLLCAGTAVGSHTCGFDESMVDMSTGETLGEATTGLFATIRQRQSSADPSVSYVARLIAGGVDRVARKVGEEATEVVIAAKNADRAELARETADLWFHSFVLLAQQNVTLDEVWAVLRERRGKQQSTSNDTNPSNDADWSPE